MHGLIPFALALAAASCTPEKSDTATDSSGSSDSSASEPTGGQSCEAALPKDEPGPAVTLKLRNDRAERVYLDMASSCTPGDAAPFQLRKSGVGIPFTQGDCDDRCELVPLGACGCNEACFDNPVLVLEPGATYTMTWNSVVRTSVPVPEVCPPMGMCESTCTIFTPSGPGDYSIHTMAAAEIVCNLGEGNPDPCDCAPNADGWCWLVEYNNYESVMPVELSAQFTLPDDTTVELVIP